MRIPSQSTGIRKRMRGLKQSQHIMAAIRSAVTGISRDCVIRIVNFGGVALSRIGKEKTDARSNAETKSHKQE